jgi:hypothetical protein
VTKPQTRPVRPQPPSTGRRPGGPRRASGSSQDLRGFVSPASRIQRLAIPMSALAPMAAPRPCGTGATRGSGRVDLARPAGNRRAEHRFALHTGPGTAFARRLRAAPRRFAGALAVEVWTGSSTPVRFERVVALSGADGQGEAMCGFLRARRHPLLRIACAPLGPCEARAARFNRALSRPRGLLDGARRRPTAECPYRAEARMRYRWQRRGVGLPDVVMRGRRQGVVRRPCAGCEASACSRLRCSCRIAQR